MNADPTDLVQTQADAWLARRMSPGLAAAEQAEFERWLATSPAHRRAYAAAEGLWGELAGLRQDEDIAALALAADVPVTRAASRWRPLLLAASVAAVAVIGTVLLKPVLFPAPQTATYATLVGQQRTIALMDGSTATLNTDTELTARYTRGQRALSLVRGEALFQVQHDPRRPFVVTAESGTVTALGTRFQVRRDAGAVTVTLLQGSVAVAQDDRPSQRRVLHPGEQAEYGAGIAGITHRQVDPQAVTGWTQGRVSFRETPLAEAVAEINRYSARKLVADPALDGITVSGNFGIHEPDAFVAALEAMFPIQAVSQGESEARLVRKK